jgi:hypothetical protein
VISTAAVVGRDRELGALADFFGSDERLPAQRVGLRTKVLRRIIHR